MIISSFKPVRIKQKKKIRKKAKKVAQGGVGQETSEENEKQLVKKIPVLILYELKNRQIIG